MSRVCRIRFIRQCTASGESSPDTDWASVEKRRDGIRSQYETYMISEAFDDVQSGRVGVESEPSNSHRS